MTKSSNCKYYRSRGNVLAGCTHPKEHTACIYQYIAQCPISENKYQKKRQ